MECKSFYSWLYKQRHRTDEVGDLAKLALRDPHWPINRRTLAGFKKHLKEHYYFEESFIGLEKAWQEWENYQNRNR